MLCCRSTFTLRILLSLVPNCLLLEDESGCCCCPLPIINNRDTMMMKADVKWEDYI